MIMTKVENQLNDTTGNSTRMMIGIITMDQHHPIHIAAQEHIL